MEEYVGQLWHRFITNAASKEYPDAAVTLDEVRLTVGVLFRALGGDAGLQIVTSLKTDSKHRRNLLQRIAGTGKQLELASRDNDKLSLPIRIAIFPDKSLNRDLYLWLAVLAAQETPDTGYWLAVNSQKTYQLLQHYPGLAPRYQRLVKAHLQQRPDIDSLPNNEAAREQQIQMALQHPEEFINAQPLEHACKYAPQAVPLWLYPAPTQQGEILKTKPTEITEPDNTNSSKQQQADRKRRKAERTEEPDGKSGLLTFRLESLFSWSEYAKVDRTTDDDDDEDALRTADDIDVITVAHTDKRPPSKLKFDLDLPSAAYDDIVLGDGIPLPEWDYKKQQLQAGHCRLQVMLARDASDTQLPEKLRPHAHQLRRQLEILCPKRIWLNRQYEGTELDIDNYISQLTERKLGRMQSEMAVYRRFHNQERDLSCLLLADLSLSTDTWINNDARIIDVIQDSLFLFAEALHSTQDRFALYGFSSRHRSHIRFHQIKKFDESYDNNIRGRIAACKPGYYTRMGAAIRYASQLLEKETAEQKLLLLLTDGKPNDLDKYEGRYGIEDTRMARLEAKKLGIKPFCVTIDEQAEDYLPYLFGKNAYAFIKKAEDLPKKLPLLYARLTNNI